MRGYNSDDDNDVIFHLTPRVAGLAIPGSHSRQLSRDRQTDEVI